MSIGHALKSYPLIICMGPGGVGKTSIAASLGLRAASMGRKTLVLTIDPARRLADAMGLRLGTDSIEEVCTQPLQPLGVELKAPLHAAMFDHATSMDSLIRRVAPSEKIADSILNNRVYRAMAGTLAKSHAYLAMERLHEIMATSSYDLIILDTPPAQNALDILDAPNRLASFLEEGVLRWFLPDDVASSGENDSGAHPKQSTGVIASASQKIREKISAVSGAAAKKLLGVVLGQALVGEMVQFFSAFAQLRQGFLDRAVEMGERLVDPSTGYVLVSSTRLSHLHDTCSLLQGIKQRNISPLAVVFNQSYEVLGEDPNEIVLHHDVDEVSSWSERWLHENWPELERVDIPLVQELLLAIMTNWQTTVAANCRSIKNVAAKSEIKGLDCVKVFVPQQGTEICDLVGLYRLSQFLDNQRS